MSTIRAFFSPHGGCRDVILEQLKLAQSEILMMVYTFTSIDIAVELIKHKAITRVIGDGNGMYGNGCKMSLLQSNGIQCLVDHKHAIHHNKVIVIDRRIVIAGSYNFTEAAESHNAENLLLISDRTIAALYYSNWQEHFLHSIPYTDHPPTRAAIPLPTELDQS